LRFKRRQVILRDDCLNRKVISSRPVLFRICKHKLSVSAVQKVMLEEIIMQAQLG
jgi:hypothetical protein